MFLEVYLCTSRGWKTPCVHGRLGEMVVRGSGRKECVAASRGRAPGRRKHGSRECVTKEPDRLGWEKASEKWAFEGESEWELGRGRKRREGPCGGRQGQAGLWVRQSGGEGATG